MAKVGSNLKLKIFFEKFNNFEKFSYILLWIVAQLLKFDFQRIFKRYWETSAFGQDGMIGTRFPLSLEAMGGKS